ncbi:MarR family transcriptional regulator [Brachybacterium sp. NBEC-018]|uniref:MarR family winged helix-turn-helix transcriptional regulator n=1 Tax=Brachybacterium sp. NBEC-018 TaxID=2996004 RepID=UPI0021755CC4|nr:MarR family transcriptional regulator [Brachybacterium sp. NBEC-018]UVY82507.1 MarR family transcriptional regulator [Brachybacterium sp. NBEC-018]
MEITPEPEPTEPPWLDETETQTWLALASVVLRGLRPIEQDLRRTSGLTLFEYMVLSRLSMSPDRRARMSDLAFLANGSPTRLANVITRFERQGWVRREADATDRRGAHAILTEAGFAVVEQAAPAHVRSVREHAIDRLDPEQSRALRAIAHTLTGDC